LNGDAIPSDNDTAINVMWKKEILVSTSQITSEPIIFSNPPIIQFSERLEPRRYFSGTGSRYNVRENRGSGTITLLPNIDVFRENTFDTDIDLDASQINTLPTFGESGIGTVRSPIRIPSYTGGGSIIKTRIFPLSSSMEGGEFVFKNIDVSSSSPPELASLISTTNYSASIVRVINETTAELYPPFNYNTTYVVNGELRTYSKNSFKNSANFTASWLNPQSASLGATQSYLHLEFSNLQPTIGSVKSIQISYKEIGGFGKKYDLGKYEIGSQNLLTDPNSVQFYHSGIQEKRIGYLDDLDNPAQYWDTGSFGTNITGLSLANNLIQGGVYVDHDGIVSASQYAFIKLKSNYGVTADDTDEFEIEFMASPLDRSKFRGQLDVYISGSEIRTNPITTNRVFDPIENTEFGTFIGNIASNSGSFVKFKQLFSTLERNKKIIPVFVDRSSRWAIGSIELKSTSGRGYTPNRARLDVPLPILPAGQELIFDIRYLNEKDEPSELIQELSGLYFQGSDPEFTSIFDSNVEYRDIGDWNRLILRKEFQISYSSSLGESSLIQYVTQSYMSSSGITPATVDIRFPIFKDNVSNASYSGSQNFVGLNFHIETIVVGKTGSFSTQYDTNAWSSTIQGRAMVSQFDNFGQPFIFETIVFSGSGERSLGTYGSGSANPKKNLDSWYTIPLIARSNDDLRVRHTLTPTNSFGTWEFYFTTTCKINKFEYKI
jgi:hypothetical protein